MATKAEAEQMIIDAIASKLRDGNPNQAQSETINNLATALQTLRTTRE